MSRTPKAELNELAQAKNMALIFATELLDANRPNQGFICQINWNGTELGKGYGISKKEAEHDASRNALLALNGTSATPESNPEDDELEEVFEQWEIHPELLAECLRIAAKTETNLETIREQAVALYQDLLLDLGYEPEPLEE